MAAPEISQQETDLLREAVAIIVAAERIRFPEKEEHFWIQFQDILLAVVIERREELL